MATRTIKLPQPVIVDRFWKNRKHDAVVVQLREYEGRNLIDIRSHFTDRDGVLKPTSKGISLVIARLPDLKRSIDKAVAKAEELGLIEAPE